MSKTERILSHLQINEETGVSPWAVISDLEKLLGFPLVGNGSAYIQTDRGIGLKYTIEKQRDESTNKVTAFRTTGFSPFHVNPVPRFGMADHKSKTIRNCI